MQNAKFKNPPTLRQNRRRCGVPTPDARGRDVGKNDNSKFKIIDSLVRASWDLRFGAMVLRFAF